MGRDRQTVREYAAVHRSLVQRRRTDAAEGTAGIIDLFVRNNGVRYINLPTNWLEAVSHFRNCRALPFARIRISSLHINIALDGLRESHDFMRGVPGNFDKALESAGCCGKLKTDVRTSLDRQHQYGYHARQSG